MPTGSSLQKTDETVQKIEDKLNDVKEKLDVVSRIEEESANVTLKLVEDYEKVDGRTFAEIKNAVYESVKDIRPAEISLEESSSGSSGGFGGGGGNMMANFQRLLGIGSESERIVLKGP